MGLETRMASSESTGVTSGGEVEVSCEPRKSAQWYLDQGAAAVRLHKQHLVGIGGKARNRHGCSGVEFENAGNLCELVAALSRTTASSSSSVSSSGCGAKVEVRPLSGGHQLAAAVERFATIRKTITGLKQTAMAPLQAALLAGLRALATRAPTQQDNKAAMDVQQEGRTSIEEGAMLRLVTGLTAVEKVEDEIAAAAAADVLAAPGDAEIVVSEPRLLTLELAEAVLHFCGANLLAVASIETISAGAPVLPEDFARKLPSDGEDHDDDVKRHNVKQQSKGKARAFRYLRDSTDTAHESSSVHEYCFFAASKATSLYSSAIGRTTWRRRQCFHSVVTAFLPFLALAADACTAKDDKITDRSDAFAFRLMEAATPVLGELFRREHLFSGFGMLHSSKRAKLAGRANRDEYRCYQKVFFEKLREMVLSLSSSTEDEDPVFKPSAKAKAAAIRRGCLSTLFSHVYRVCCTSTAKAMASKIMADEEGAITGGEDQQHQQPAAATSNKRRRGVDDGKKEPLKPKQILLEEIQDILFQAAKGDESSTAADVFRCLGNVWDVARQHNGYAPSENKREERETEDLLAELKKTTRGRIRESLSAASLREKSSKAAGSSSTDPGRAGSEHGEERLLFHCWRVLALVMRIDHTVFGKTILAENGSLWGELASSAELEPDGALRFVGTVLDVHADLSETTKSVQVQPFLVDIMSSKVLGKTIRTAEKRNESSEKARAAAASVVEAMLRSRFALTEACAPLCFKVLKPFLRKVADYKKASGRGRGVEVSLLEHLCASRPSLLSAFCRFAHDLCQWMPLETLSEAHAAQKMIQRGLDRATEMLAAENEKKADGAPNDRADDQARVVSRDRFEVLVSVSQLPSRILQQDEMKNNHEKHDGAASSKDLALAEADEHVEETSYFPDALCVAGQDDPAALSHSVRALAEKLLERGDACASSSSKLVRENLNYEVSQLLRGLLSVPREALNFCRDLIHRMTEDSCPNFAPLQKIQLLARLPGGEDADEVAAKLYRQLVVLVVDALEPKLPPPKSSDSSNTVPKEDVASKLRERGHVQLFCADISGCPTCLRVGLPGVKNSTPPLGWGSSFSWEAGRASATLNLVDACVAISESCRGGREGSAAPGLAPECGRAKSSLLCLVERLLPREGVFVSLGSSAECGHSSSFVFVFNHLLRLVCAVLMHETTDNGLEFLSRCSTRAFVIDREFFKAAKEEVAYFPGILEGGEYRQWLLLLAPLVLGRGTTTTTSGRYKNDNGEYSTAMHTSRTCLMDSREDDGPNKDDPHSRNPPEAPLGSSCVVDLRRLYAETFGPCVELLEAVGSADRPAEIEEVTTARLLRLRKKFTLDTIEDFYETKLAQQTAQLWNGFFAARFAEMDTEDHAQLLSSKPELVRVSPIQLAVIFRLCQPKLIPYAFLDRVVALVDKNLVMLKSSEDANNGKNDPAITAQLLCVLFPRVRKSYRNTVILSQAALGFARNHVCSKHVHVVYPLLMAVFGHQSEAFPAHQPVWLSKHPHLVLLVLQEMLRLAGSGTTTTTNFYGEDEKDKPVEVARLFARLVAVFARGGTKMGGNREQSALPVSKYAGPLLVSYLGREHEWGKARSAEQSEARRLLLAAMNPVLDLMGDRDRQVLYATLVPALRPRLKELFEHFRKRHQYTGRV
eukprot:g17804.t1